MFRRYPVRIDATSNPSEDVMMRTRYPVSMLAATAALVGICFTDYGILLFAALIGITLLTFSVSAWVAIIAVSERVLKGAVRFWSARLPAHTPGTIFRQ